MAEQHCEFDVQCCPLCRQDAACAAVGTTIDVTTGNASAAATPIFRIATLRDMTLAQSGKEGSLGNNLARRSSLSAIHTIVSSICLPSASDKA